MNVSASIVVYNENPKTLERVIEDFLAIDLKKELVIVDNSSTDKIRVVCEKYDSIKYIFNGKNLGFGTGHNLAFNSLYSESKIHMIINPDTYFNSNDIKDFILWMGNNTEISLSVPKVYFPDTTPQYTIRNIPTPMTLIKRRLNINGIFDSFVKKDEFRDVEFKEIEEIPFAHGCFFLFQTDVFRKLEGFDERFFMYMEDVDIFIRAKKFGTTVVNSKYKIFHEFRKESSKNIKLLLWHIISSVKFFIKHK